MELLSKVKRMAAGAGLGALVVVLAGVVLAAGCKGRTAPAAAPDPNAPIRVVVSIAPLKGLVAPLVEGLGERASVELIVPVGAMEHGFEVPPSMITKLLKADVVVYVGAGLEPQIEKLLREHPDPRRRAVCFAEVVGIDVHDHTGHDHGADDHDHDHDVDPHLWLDPSLVARLVPAVAGAVANAAGDRGWKDVAAGLRDAGDGPAAELTRRVAGVAGAYKTRLDPLAGRVMITAHAAWGRLAERYKLEMVPLAGMEASEPSPAAISRAADLIKEKKAGVIFSEPQISAATVDRLAQMTGARVLVLDPLGDGDWFGMMNANLDAIVDGLKD